MSDGAAVTGLLKYERSVGGYSGAPDAAAALGTPGGGGNNPATARAVAEDDTIAALVVRRNDRRENGVMLIVSTERPRCRPERTEKKLTVAQPLRPREKNHSHVGSGFGKQPSFFHWRRGNSVLSLQSSVTVVSLKSKFRVPDERLMTVH